MTPQLRVHKANALTHRPQLLPECFSQIMSW